MTGFTPGGPLYAEGPVALIIGCGDMGMGAARALGRRHPLVIADISRERLDAAVATLDHEGFFATGHVCDITDPDQVKTLADAVAGSGVKVLAHIAGVGASIGSWQKMMAVDLTGVHLVVNAVGPHMVKGGVCIMVASLAGYLSKVDPRIDALVDDPLQDGFLDKIAEAHGGEPGFGPCYAYAKLGVIRLAEKLAVAWGPRQVRAVTITPGMIDTSIGRNDGAMLPDGKGGFITRAEKVREIPLGRQGTLPEITGLVEYLASDAASFINGIDIVMDGGQRAGWRQVGAIGR